MKKINYFILAYNLFLNTVFSVDNSCFNLAYKINDLFLIPQFKAKINNTEVRNKYLNYLAELINNPLINKNLVLENLDISIINLIEENIMWAELRSIGLEDKKIYMIKSDEFDYLMESNYGYKSNKEFKKMSKILKRSLEDEFDFQYKEEVAKLSIEVHEAIKREAIKEAATMISIFLANNLILVHKSFAY